MWQCFLILISIAGLCFHAGAEINFGHSEKVDILGPASLKIRRIIEQPGEPVPRSNNVKYTNQKLSSKTIELRRNPSEEESATNSQQNNSVTAFTIYSPPVDGFVPWIVVTVTNERAAELDLFAYPQDEVVGGYPVSNPEANYSIGIFDTGASASVIGYNNAVQMGLFDSGGLPKQQYLTDNFIPISGVTGTVDAYVSQPLGLFIDGLGVIEPNDLVWDRSNMVGETNVSVAVGDAPFENNPDLITAIGTPLSVFFDTSIKNDTQVTVIRDSNQYTSPDIRLYDYNDSNCPSYSNWIPLELRPLGAANVAYVIDTLDLDFDPGSPSTIIGNQSQSIYFVHSVSLYDGLRTAIDQDRFMLDTGAQVTVIGSRMAAMLELDPCEPEFEVEIIGVTGEVTMAPGYYIDKLEIPAIGQWLSFENVPAIWLDIASPEGGTLDGIIGMNLFINFNLVLRGGGFFTQDDPALEFEPINYAEVVDVAPGDGDGFVDGLDLAELISHWLETASSSNWHNKYDVAPAVRDGVINLYDIALIAHYWFDTAN